MVRSVLAFSALRVYGRRGRWLPGSASLTSALADADDWIVLSPSSEECEAGTTIRGKTSGLMNSDESYMASVAISGCGWG